MRRKVIGIRTAGVVYALISAIVGLVSTNSGNNLLYLITAMLLSFLLSSGIIGRRNLYGAELSVSFPDEIYAEEQCAIKVNAVNRKLSVPLFLISIEYGENEAFFPMVQPGQTLENAIFTKFHDRGRHMAGFFHISSVFPFDLFKRYRSFDIKDSVVVFPSPLKCLPEAVFISDEMEDDENNDKESSSSVFVETDIVGIRPYEEGDSFRRVHWKSSAKTGKLNTKLYEGESAGAGKIIELDRLVSAGIERGLSMASYAISESMKSGIPIGMLTRGTLIPPSAERQHKLKLLEILADYHE
jgi:uncharacterized protein (DUF58 family)